MSESIDEAEIWFCGECGFKRNKAEENPPETLPRCPKCGKLTIWIKEK